MQTLADDVLQQLQKLPRYEHGEFLTHWYTGIENIDLVANETPSEKLVHKLHGELKDVFLNLKLLHKVLSTINNEQISVYKFLFT